jgi:hypothetical protein
MDLAIRIFPRQFYSSSIFAKFFVKAPTMLLAIMFNLVSRVIPTQKMHALQWVGADHLLAATLAAGAYSIKSRL